VRNPPRDGDLELAAGPGSVKVGLGPGLKPPLWCFRVPPVDQGRRRGPPGRWELGGVRCRRSLALAGGRLRCGPTTAWPSNGAIRAAGWVPWIGNAICAPGRVAFPTILILAVSDAEVQCGMSVRDLAIP
jgi:hypothetical protein